MFPEKFGVGRNFDGWPLFAEMAGIYKCHAWALHECWFVRFPGAGKTLSRFEVVYTTWSYIPKSVRWLERRMFDGFFIRIWINCDRHFYGGFCF